MHYSSIYSLVEAMLFLFAAVFLIRCMTIKWNSPVDKDRTYYECIAKNFLCVVVGGSLLLLILIIEAFHKEYGTWM